MKNQTQKTATQKALNIAHESRPAVHRQDFLTLNFSGEPIWLYRLKLNRRDQQDAEEYAAAFGLPMATFLERFFGHDLPGQVLNEDGRRLAIDPGEWDLSRISPELAKRLAQAARYDGITPAEFVARDIESTLAVTEELFLLHPETGEMLAENAWLEEWILEKRWIGPAESAPLCQAD